MKLHHPLAKAAVGALAEIFSEQRHADKVIERVLKSHREFGARDRRFVAETVYEITRWWRLLWATLGSEPSLDDKNLWRLLGTWFIVTDRENGSKGTTSTSLPAWPEFQTLTDVQSIRARYHEVQKNPALRASVPDWMYARGEREIGAPWNQFLEELNRPAPVWIRANTLRTTREKLQQELTREGIETTAGRATYNSSDKSSGNASDYPLTKSATSGSAPVSLRDALLLHERKNIFLTDAFKQGMFEVQDGASQQVAPLLAPQPGERVIDACAGAGGKTLHLAALMKNKGKILALDIHDRRLEELRKRTTRAGAEIVETRLIENAKTIKRLEETADALLLDVPCSGLGVLRRNPDAKWKLTEEEIENLLQLQTHLLKSYSRMLKPGGRMVYATCSILPSENEKQVARFVEEHPEFHLNEEYKFAPGAHGFDGFYAAKLTKK